MSIISLNNVSYQYPTSQSPVLQDITLDFEAGKFYALIGANGSGKTSLCNVIRGFIPHFYKGDLQGDVIVCGKDIRQWQMGELAPKIGYVFQNPFTQISGVKEAVFDEIAFGLENLGVETGEIRNRVDSVLTQLGIEALRDKNPFELSGGQKQRVALASIIVMEPDILVIDEPTSQLDPEGTEEVFAIIELMKRSGKTIILVEHKIELIASYADHVVLLHDGKVALSGETEQVLTDEAVLSYHTALPQYALFGMEMKRQQMDLGTIPLTEAQAIAAVQSWLRAKEGGA
ncbi:energy-coupling factor ABC transporter ATP-binding protein [Paenibacillus sp. J2TS4]|uniref:energy-coupling factor ABC transporter ATP-binding protein n=1 Tax=Paenibacillus sp. J2TS4 TaxID=2807194 RepID=UPI001B18BE6E|nr:ABC transporter ATP-binding protein [Paenibacillus sp. J2TS4]GIP31971.1 ABC transporter ATP-binding protein [Paenibacillus sp. J2TS4]